MFFQLSVMQNIQGGQVLNINNLLFFSFTKMLPKKAGNLRKKIDFLS